MSLRVRDHQELNKMRQFIIANDKKGDIKLKKLLAQSEVRIETEHHHGSKTLV